MKENRQPKKNLLELMSLMKMLAQTGGIFFQTTILPISLAQWLKSEGCQVWYAGTSEFHTPEDSSENFLWLVLYEHPYPGTFSEELYRLACSKQDHDWAVEIYYLTSPFSEETCDE